MAMVDEMSMITATTKAAMRVAELKKEASLDDSYFIRVAVEGGGCSGLSYKLDFDNKTRKGDQSFESNGIKIVVDMKSFLYLCGTELDFGDGLNGKGFNFVNPNATRTCGCGESFAV
jgi:iron-sulfur cluster assembly protein